MSRINSMGMGEWQRRLDSVTSILQADPDLLLMARTFLGDEPFTLVNMDPVTRTNLMRLHEAIKDGQKSICVARNNRDLLLEIPDELRLRFIAAEIGL